MPSSYLSRFSPTSRGQLVELGEDPLVLELERFGQLVFVDREIHHHEAGSVPELVGEVAHRLAALREEAHVVSGRVAGDDVEAERVRAVGVDDLDGIDAVAERTWTFSCPAASRIRPWMSTVWNGIFFICSQPEKIMRATQKKMMS